MNQNRHDTSKPTGGRRRFLGAGAAATPALLTLASQPALGVTCFTPSRSLSKNTSVSQQGKNGNCTGAESPGNYKARVPPQAGNSWPAAIPPSTPFHPLFSGVNIKFYQSNGTTSLTLLEVLNVVGAPDSQQVAFHIIAAYLNINGGNGAVIPPHVLDSVGVKKIWNEWDLNGYYQPFATVKWYAAEIKNYLISNGIVL